MHRWQTDYYTPLLLYNSMQSITNTTDTRDLQNDRITHRSCRTCTDNGSCQLGRYKWRRWNRQLRHNRQCLPNSLVRSSRLHKYNCTIPANWYMSRRCGRRWAAWRTRPRPSRTTHPSIGPDTSTCNCSRHPHTSHHSGKRAVYNRQYFPRNFFPGNLWKTKKNILNKRTIFRLISKLI
jgi:hypothetical protein